ncbi:MAG: ATP-binding cassette domain-containing protein, partial [Patescibacteria group bacterium]
MPSDEIILRFDNVSFEYRHNKRIFEDVSFSVRRGMKVTLMGQNGSGKSTLFNLIMRTIVPESGKVNINKDLSIATALQVIPRKEIDVTIREFFEKRFSKKTYNIDPLIDRVLEVVNMPAPHDRIVKSFSGGQQARLLLASALIQDPDILLLDEPTNNLDRAGIKHLTEFLKNYKKTVIVISHDAGFLNSFTEGVLYLDI